MSALSRSGKICLRLICLGIIPHRAVSQSAKRGPESSPFQLLHFTNPLSSSHLYVVPSLHFSPDFWPVLPPHPLAGVGCLHSGLPWASEGDGSTGHSHLGWPLGVPTSTCTLTNRGKALQFTVCHEHFYPPAT